jgi:probable HAF family extracellular repeat protein
LVGFLRAAPPQYLVADLGPVGEFTESRAVNWAGQVAGVVSDRAQQAVIWNGSIPTYLNGPVGGPSRTLAEGLNNVGQAVGIAFGGRSSRAVLWNGATPVDLGEGGAFDINDSGQIAGVLLSGGQFKAVRWDGTTLVELGWPAGTTRSDAYGINAAGQVIGIATDADRVSHATIWNGTIPTLLDAPGARMTLAYGINAAGQVAGESVTAAGESHAVLWDGTTPIDLGLLVPGGYSTGRAVNVFGDVVGLASSAPYDSEDPLYRGFIYTDGTMYDLNSFLLTDSEVVVVSATGINDSGQIAADGTIDGQRHAMLLTPVPEPASAMLLLCGAALLTSRRR